MNKFWDVDDDCKFWNDWKLYCLINRINYRWFEKSALCGNFWDAYKDDFVDFYGRLPYDN